MFDTSPELRALFHNDMTQQTRMLTSMLGSLVKGLNRLQEIEGGLRALGRRRRDYNIDQADYEKVLRALLLTLGEFLGNDFTPEVSCAWKTVYGKITETMIDAQADVGSSP
jgi:hemoglobin-like flavoprotein